MDDNELRAAIREAGADIASKINPPAESWHLDKRVPIGLIFALLVQTITLVYVGSTWKAETDGRLSTVETAIEDNILLRRKQWDRIEQVEKSQQTLDARLAGLDERTRSIASQTDRILNLLLKQIGSTK